MTQVRAHTTHTKTGKVVRVRAYTRSSRAVPKAQPLARKAGKRWARRRRAPVPWWNRVLGG